MAPYSTRCNVLWCLKCRTLCLENGAIDSEFRKVKAAGRFVTVAEHVMLLIDEINNASDGIPA